jgi:hypothetical protein
MDRTFIDAPDTKPRRRYSLFRWSAVMLLLLGFVFASWIGSFYIFSHPEKPASYKLLKALKKIDPPKRFEITAAPPGRFYTAKELYDLYLTFTPLQLEQENEQLLRDYIRNYTETKKLVPYLTGCFTTLGAHELGSSDAFPSGIVAVGKSVECPQVMVEHVYTASDGNVPLLRQMLATSLEMKLAKTLDLSAVVHVEKLSGGKILFTVLPLSYGNYAFDRESFSLDPPPELNLEAGVPVVKTAALDDAIAMFAVYRKTKGVIATAAPKPTPAMSAPPAMELALTGGSRKIARADAGATPASGNSRAFHSAAGIDVDVARQPGQTLARSATPAALARSAASATLANVAAAPSGSLSSPTPSAAADATPSHTPRTQLALASPQFPPVASTQPRTVASAQPANDTPHAPSVAAVTAPAPAAAHVAAAREVAVADPDATPAPVVTPPAHPATNTLAKVSSPQTPVPSAASASAPGAIERAAARQTEQPVALANAAVPPSQAAAPAVKPSKTATAASSSPSTPPMSAPATATATRQLARAKPEPTSPPAASSTAPAPKAIDADSDDAKRAAFLAATRSTKADDQRAASVAPAPERAAGVSPAPAAETHPSKSNTQIAKASPARGNSPPSTTPLTAASRVTPHPSPSAFASAMPSAPASSPAASGVKLQPFIAAQSPAGAPTATGTWHTYRPGEMPRGKLLDAREASDLASQGIGGERIYLGGQFLVTASGHNRVILRPENAGGKAPSAERIIVDFPAGMVPPRQGATIARDELRPFQIIDARRGTDGRVTVYAREITTAGPAAGAMSASTAGVAPAPAAVPASYRPWRGRLLDSREASELADAGVGGEKLFLSGQFVVTASEENRAVLRPQTAGGKALASPRIIVKLPSGVTPPPEGARLARDDAWPFRIVDVQRDNDGQVNVYVREPARIQ